jgi:hypothetical protein
MSNESQYSKYKDPTNFQDIVDRIKNASTHDDVVNIINSTFPTWVLGWPKKYSYDYKHFNDNWLSVCTKTKCNPLNVVIVDYIVFNDSDYKLVQIFSELLTLFGHSVRRKEEFVSCKVCGDAIPAPKLYAQLKERKIPTPDVWMYKCTSC